MLAQGGVGVHRHGIAHEREHRDVVGRVGVRRAAAEVEPLALSDGAHGLGLGHAVQGRAHQAAGVDAVADLGHRAQCPGQAEVLGDDGRELDRGGGHEPDPLPGVQVALGQGEGAGDQLVAHLVGEDLLAEVDELGHASALDERQRGLGRRCHVLEVLGAAHDEPRLLAPKGSDLREREELAAGKPHGKVEEAGPLQHGVVDVEEGGGRRIRRDRQDGLDIGSGSRCLPGNAVGGQHGRRATRHAARVDRLQQPWLRQTRGVREARVMLVGKPGCHLCDEAREVIAAVCADQGVDWVEVSILDDPDLADRYWEKIPVTLVDGVEHDFWRVDAARLRAALATDNR